jgi:hypothetical protein
MALHLNFDHNSRSYLTVTCDGCSARFLCYDDACYNFTSLRTEAVFAGWDVRPRPEQPDYCPSCVRQRNTSHPHRITPSGRGRTREDRPQLGLQQSQTGDRSSGGNTRPDMAPSVPSMKDR